MSFPRERSRVTPSVVTPAGTFTEENTTGGSICGWNLLATWNTGEQSDYKSEWIGDYVTPNFKKAIANGRIVNNPFRRVLSTVKYPRAGNYFNLMRKSNYYSCSPSGSVQNQRRLQGMLTPPHPDFLWDNSDVTEMRNRVINLAVTQSHANVDTTALLAMATAAEGRKTIESIASISSRAYTVLKQARKLNWRALKKQLKAREVADRYMEIRYALRPVVYDMVGAMKAYAEERQSHVRQTYRGYASDGTSLSDEITIGLAWGTSARWRRDFSYQISARAGVLCEVDITTASLLGSNQYIETLWELAPFSFIADWFANIGDTIAAWTPNAGVQQRASWVTVRETRTATSSMLQAISTATSVGFVSGTCSHSGGSASKEELVLERIVEPALSTFPQVSINLDTYKLLDLGIIMRKLFR